eukprot:scaffold164445_cov22-Tisochrysis_lutea.AAC.1
MSHGISILALHHGRRIPSHYFKPAGALQYPSQECFEHCTLTPAAAASEPFTPTHSTRPPALLLLPLSVLHSFDFHPKLVTQAKPLADYSPAPCSYCPSQNEFHPKYVTQAKALADPRTGVAGTMYERYYDLGSSFAKLQSLQDLDEAGAQLARREFYTLCEQRAQEALGAPVTSYTIENGATIEQAALLTSHNYHMLLRVRTALVSYCALAHRGQLLPCPVPYLDFTYAGQLGVVLLPSSAWQY